MYGQILNEVFCMVSAQGENIRFFQTIENFVLLDFTSRPADEYLCLFIVVGIRFEDRAFVNRHIRDIEVYLAGSLGAILSGEDEGATPGRAKSDEMTLQNSVDELLKNSAGRFDYAIELMEAFATVKNLVVFINFPNGSVFSFEMPFTDGPFHGQRVHGRPPPPTTTGRPPEKVVEKRERYMRF